MLLWSGQTVSEVGSAITQLAIPLTAVILLKATTLEVAFLSGLATLPFLLVSLPVGAIVDRRAKHRLMMWCDVGRFLLLASIPLATLPGLHVTYVQLLIVSLLTGILTVFFDVAYQSYLPVLLDKVDLMDGNGKLGTSSSFAQFAGPSIGGGLIGLIGSAHAITADAASYVVSAMSLFLIRKEELKPEPRAEGHAMKRDIREGLTFVVKHPILRKVVCCTGTANFFASMSGAVGMIFLVRTLRVTPVGVGLIYSVTAVGGMVGGLLAGRLARWIGGARIIWLSILVLGAPEVLVPLATPGWGLVLYAVGYFCISVEAVVYNTAQVTYRQAICPPEMLGRMNASVRFLVWGSLPVGAAVGGVLGTQFGIRDTMWVAVIGGWAAGFWVLFSPLRAMRDFPVNDAYLAKTPLADTVSAAEPE